MGFSKRRLCQRRKSRKLLVKKWIHKIKTSNSTHTGNGTAEPNNLRQNENFIQYEASTSSNGILHNDNEASIQHDSNEIFSNDESMIQSQISGRRIVDIQYFLKSVLEFPHNELFRCSGNNLSLVKEVRNGLQSTFELSCRVCNVTYQIYSEDPNTQEISVNTAAVTGITSVGLGHSNLVEICSVLNIPPISEYCYKNVEKCILNKYDNIALEFILEAGKEEARLATECGDIDPIDGKPFISVIADCAWSRRSNRSVYNANSGVASIIGQKTGKILYLGIKNKYCCVCAAASSSDSIPEHMCFKNCNGTSTAMESTIVVEGFMASIKMHNLKYKYLIADGDSSTFNKICEARPYGDFFVEKIECKNHLLRNYCNKLKDLSGKRYSSSGKTVPLTIRSLLKGNIVRLRISVDAAVKYYRVIDGLGEAMKVAKLKEDIENSVFHVFGQHNNCKDYFCKRKNEMNFIPLMRECGLLNDIFSYSNRLIYHAKSLIKSVTNNYAESFNSVVAKYVGGKRVNHTKKGGYKLRCLAAAVSYNAQGTYVKNICERLGKGSVGFHQNKFSERNKVKRLRQKNKTYIKKKSRIISQLDKDYGPAAEQPSINNDPSDIALKKEVFLKKLQKNPTQILEIMRDTKDQRLSPLWHSERRKRLTASNFGKICKMQEKTDRKKTVSNLLAPSFTGNRYTEYGIANERKAITSLEQILNVKIECSGLFIHNEYQYLAGTPDGLIGDDGIVEIKCPYSAKDLEPEEAISSKKIKFAIMDCNNKLSLKKNDNYYYQIQGQMLVTNREYCYFVIWTPKGTLYEKIYKDSDFCDRMLPKLKEFYYNHLLPQILINTD